MMRTIGAISDTHGLLRPQALAALAGCNPGSAGPRRFRLPITVGRMTAEYGKLRAEIVKLSIER